MPFTMVSQEIRKTLTAIINGNILIMADGIALNAGHISITCAAVGEVCMFAMNTISNS